MSATKAPEAPATSPEPTPGSPAWLINQAKGLERDRGKLLERIGANRSLLRQLHKVGALNAEEKKFVTTFYPDKERGSTRSEDEVEATRKTREAARKG
jgi:hypothetical protein